MRKVFDIMKQTNGDSFEVIVKENGERVYRSWQSMKIAIDGIVEKVGVHYHEQIVVADKNDEIFTVEDMDEKEYEALYFVEDKERYAKYFRVSTVEDLIGLPEEDFNEILAARSVGLESFDKKKGRELYGE
jgi:hypothetical protein